MPQTVDMSTQAVVHLAHGDLCMYVRMICSTRLRRTLETDPPDCRCSPRIPYILNATSRNQLSSDFAPTLETDLSDDTAGHDPVPNRVMSMYSCPSVIDITLVAM